MPDTQRPRLDTVEALRGLASLAVVWYHMAGSQQASWVKASASYTWLGVEVFFVISGFIIPYSLFASSYTISQFPAFMLKRLVRLEPPYIASIVLVIVLWHLSTLAPGFVGQPPNYSAPQIAAHLFYLIPLTPFSWLNVVYWTLFYEFLFYLMIGLLYPLVIHRSMIPVYAVFAGVVGLSGALGLGASIVLQFLFGVAGFRYFACIDDWPKLLVGLAVATAATAWLSGVPAAIAGLGAVVVILWVRVPRLRPLSFLGAISYSLYLVHVPVGGRVVNLMGRLGPGNGPALVGALLGLSVSLIAASLFWYCIERPAQATSKSLGRLAKVLFRRGT